MNEDQGFERERVEEERAGTIRRDGRRRRLGAIALVSQPNMRVPCQSAPGGISFFSSARNPRRFVARVLCR